MSVPKRWRLSWGRFLYAMTLLAIGPVLITWAARPIDTAIVMLWVLYASGLVFFALGWHRLRREDAQNPLLAADFDRARKALLGKPLVAAVWFVTTLVVVLSITIGLTLPGAAA